MFNRRHWFLTNYGKTYLIHSLTAIVSGEYVFPRSNEMNVCPNKRFPILFPEVALVIKELKPLAVLDGTATFPGINLPR